MSLFGTLTSNGLEESQDRLGGFQPLNTDIYLSTIKLAYHGKSDKGAQYISLVLDAAGQEYRETVYITNQKGENFWVNSKDGNKKVPLPGFTLIDDLLLLVTDKPLSEAVTEDKVVNIYNVNEKKELPTKVPVLTELLGQKISAAIVRKLENKQVRNESSGEYEPTAEERETNAIDKLFHPELKVTVAEARGGQTTPKFYDSWLERNKDKVRDARKFNGATAGKPTAGRPAAASSGAPQANAPAPRASLFGKK